jgi:hypothetical protein
MPITERELESVKRIILDGAKIHFPPTVQFQDVNATVRLNADEEEYIDVDLLYTAPNPVLDGHLMITLFRIIDEPIRASGITARTLVHYTDINDPTRWQYRKSPTPPSPTS